MIRTSLITSLALILVFSGCATQTKSSADWTAETPRPKDQALTIAPAPVPLIQTGRYSAITASPTEAQMNLLRVMISVTLPEEVVTVEQAIQHLLRRSGYRFARPDTQLTPVAELLHKILPQVHRQLGPMPLEEALRALTGPAFDLVIDPVPREVSYQLAKAFEPAPKYQVEIVHE
ncbi:MAG: hypothetical protein ACREEM_01115 [Blastocatellia bacterium]